MAAWRWCSGGFIAGGVNAALVVYGDGASALTITIAGALTWGMMEGIAYVGRHLRVSWEREARHADH